MQQVASYGEEQNLLERERERRETRKKSGKRAKRSDAIVVNWNSSGMFIE